jgi:hypothetical protein
MTCPPRVLSGFQYESFASARLARYETASFEPYPVKQQHGSAIGIAEET